MIFSFLACKPRCERGNLCINGECKCGKGLGCHFGNQCVNGACRCGDNYPCIGLSFCFNGACSKYFV